MNRTTLPRRRRAAALIITVALAVSACGGGDDDDAAPSTTAAPTTTEVETTTTTTSTTTTSTTSTSTSTTTTTTLPVIERQPLTGEPLVEGEAVLDRPALAVKIDNAVGARRNHSGLAVADIVFEEIVEGGITRFAAVFHSRDSDPVGPIRSGRSQDVDLLTSLRQPLFAWSGGNDGVQALISQSTLVDLKPTRAGNAYYRGSGSAPHNLYSDTETLWARTPDDHPGAPPQQFEYVRPENTIDGEPTGGLELSMRDIRVEWTWDADEGRFLRSQVGAPHVDAVHGRIGATNVIVMAVQYQPSPVDARSPEAQTIGAGAALVFSEGTARRGTWTRTSAEEPFSFVDESGAPLVLAPGNTWIELDDGPDLEVTVLPAG